MAEKPWSVLFAIPLFLFLSFTSASAKLAHDYPELKNRPKPSLKKALSRAHTLYQKSKIYDLPLKKQNG